MIFLNRVKGYTVLAMMMVISLNCSSQNKDAFVYKEVESVMSERYFNSNYKVDLPENAFFADKVLNQKQSVSATTKELQKCLDTQNTVVLPNYPITISQEGITLNSNNILIFQSKSQLIMEANSLDYYQLIRIHDVSNVKVINANLKGDRQKHTGSTGEWGYGISIRNASNVFIENFKIQDFWGDGIAIGYGTTKTNKNITLKRGFLNNNRRNGLSVMNVDGLEVNNLLVANTNGTNPMFGIDFEPNNIHDHLNNISLTNLYSFNNANGGLMITFSKLKTKKEKSIGFVVNNFTDSGSPHGVMLAGVPKDATGLKGKIMLKNITLDNNQLPLTGRLINNAKVMISVEDLTVSNPRNKNINNKEIKRVFDLKKNYQIKFSN